MKEDLYSKILFYFVKQPSRVVLRNRRSHRSRPVKKVFLKISEHSQENTCAGVSFALKRDSDTGVFLWIFQNFKEHLFWRNVQTAACRDIAVLTLFYKLPGKDLRWCTIFVMFAKLHSISDIFPGLFGVFSDQFFYQAFANNCLWNPEAATRATASGNRDIIANKTGS